MSTIAEHLGINPKQIVFKHHDALIGVGALGFEVELENPATGNWPSVKGWVKKDDGSLRAGKEYIFDGPQSGEDALASIEAFHEVMRKVKPDPTFRCSTHCHLDVRDMTFSQYERLILTYIVFEDTMFDMIDRRRRDSNFCIPFYKNDWLSANFGRRVMGAASDRHKFSGCGNWPKYSALNLQVTASFGSVEFRGSHAMTSKEELLGLGQRMLHMKRAAMDSKAKDNFVFLKELEELGPHGVFRQGIPKDYVMDAGALEQGLATAMHCMLTADMHKAGVDIAPPPRAAAGNANQQTIRIINGERVELNMEVLMTMNVVPRSRTTNTRDALALVASLNRLRGVNVSVSQIVRINATHLGWLAMNLEAYNAATGNNFTAEQMR